MMIVAAGLLVSMVGPVWAQGAVGPMSYRNPVIEEDLADPAVIFHDGVYYLYGTGQVDGDNGYRVYTSINLIQWQRGPVVFKPGTVHVWAPDVWRDPKSGRFYLYYTADHTIGVAEADGPTGPFTDRRKLVQRAIDAHMFHDDDGRLYLYYVQLPGFRITVQPMATPTEPTGEPRVVLQPQADWETRAGRVTEGPWIIKHRGKYYLLYSGSGANTPDYAVGYAVADSPMGPFERGTNNPIVHRGPGVFGPGHGCVVRDAAGRLWHVYHQKRTDRLEWGRFVCIDPLWFDEQGRLYGRATRGTVEPGPCWIIPQRPITQQVLDFLAVSNPDTLSAASKRAIERHYDQGPEWYCEFVTHDLKGDFAYEEGVVRRDPSSVIRVDGTYYVYYTRSTGKTYGFGTGDPEKKVFPWDQSEIWVAASKDGWTWKELHRVVARGPSGAFDDRSVFTPEVLVHDGKYVLVYQTVKAPYANRVKNQVGMAIGTAPEGPFKKLDAPILSPADNGQWLGDEDTRFKVVKQGDFDSHKVHDPTLIYYRGQFRLYYKGERMGERLTFGGREIRWGVAISDRLTGPYVKSPYNPITNSGHEVCIWPYRGGIAALLISDGPERNTIQWAPDGIHFEIKSHIRSGPHAAGLVRSLDTEKAPLEALSWGLTHRYKSRDWQYIQRFEKRVSQAP